MQVVPLSEVPHHLDAVAQWVWDEWRGSHSSQTFEEVRSILQGRATAPPTLIALDGAVPVGVLGFRRVMFRGREPLLLWINALFVVETHRDRGVGTALLYDALGRVGPEDAAVYVYAAIRGWYQARNFVMVEAEGDTGNAVLRASRPFPTS